MNCHDFTQHLDDYLDDYLDGSLPERHRMTEHLTQCDDCARRYGQALALKNALQEMPAPVMSAAFQQKMLGEARQTINASHREGWRFTFPAGLAATLLLALGIGFWWPAQQQGHNDQDMTAFATNDLSDVFQSRTVNLVFNSGQALQGVTLTLELPDGVETPDFPGEQRISWQVDIDQGANVLSLPLNIRGQQQRELVALLEYGESHKRFTTNILPNGQG